MQESENRISLSYWLLPHPKLRLFLRSLEGEIFDLYPHMRSKIWEQVGTPKENVDWSDPEEWVPDRLNNAEAELALKIWRTSEGTVNPRHTDGAWAFCNKYALIERGQDGKIVFTPAGRSFLTGGDESLIAKIDSLEGMLNVLQIVSEHSPGKRGDILPGYVDFCSAYTTTRSDSTQKTTLYDRLVNLTDRGYIMHQGMYYEITEAGIKYLAKNADLIIGRKLTVVQTDLHRTAKDITKQTRKQLKAYLSEMDPYLFEQLIGLLLTEMGYTNVVVTSQSGDKGVDVVADIELGISSVREVVQVKRHSSTITRPTLDMLRGSLHRFKALRGTIITTSTFAQGAKSAAFENQAAPITLIDGEKLIDLLIEYGIGVIRKSVEYVEFDEMSLKEMTEGIEPAEK